MTKVLFLLSAVVMVVAGFFSYQNRETFIQTRKARTDAVEKLKDEMKNVAKVNNEIGTVRDSITGVNAEVTTATERLNTLKDKLKKAEADAASLEKEVTEKQKGIAELKTQFTELPEGMTLETITVGINKLKQDIADAEAKITQAQDQVAVKDGEIKKAQSRLDGVREKIESRKTLFERNSLSATIVAVNNDWGFVVIDGGQNKGITADAKLLVTRGPDTIGRLSIIGVDGNKTVANIDQKSVRPGVSVAPGDRVILETLYQ